MGYLFIGFGGALGSISRVMLTKLLPHFIWNLPMATLCVNILGCFVFGVLTEILALYWSASLNLKKFIVQGFLGGFTTFSAFALEFNLLYAKGHYISAFIYAALSVVLSLVGFLIGLKLVKIFSI